MKSATHAALAGIVFLSPGLARAQAELSVEKTATPELAIENRLIDYRIVVTNAGPDEALDVELVDNLPEDVALINIDGRCISETPTRLRCLLGNLTQNESRILEVQVRAPALTGLSPVQQIITNSAEVESTREGPVFATGDQAEVVVVPEEDAADLSINLTSSTPRLNEVQFTLEVFNNSAIGVDDVTTVFRMDKLPLFEVLEITPTQGNCLTPLDTCIGDECDGLENELAEVTCNLGTLIETATERAVITVSTEDFDEQALRATATVSGDRADPDLSNNLDTESPDTSTNASTVLDEVGATCVASRLAAGRPMERDLNHLRRVRDRMKRYAWGRRFVAGYYRVSPGLSRRLDRHPRVCAMGRALLKPVLAVARRL